MAALPGVTNGGLAPERGLGGTSPAAPCRGLSGAGDWGLGTVEGPAVAGVILYSGLGPDTV